MKDLDTISGDVVDVALRLHRELGPGLLESVYEIILASVGLLINFGGETSKEGLRRIVNDYRPSAPSRLRVNQ